MSHRRHNTEKVFKGRSYKGPKAFRGGVRICDLCEKDLQRSERSSRNQ